MHWEFEMNGTMMIMMINPTNVSDSSNHKEESVEVGVIVMGLCCICLVACALVVLQLRSNNRRISGNRQRSGPTGNVSADRSRDPLDAGAPPSYDAVIRSPHLYPPSRRTSLTLDISDTRRSSGSSVFSLSVHSPRLIHHLRAVPTGLSEDNLSQHTEIQLRGSQEEDNEEPPPPYPGKRTSRDASITDHIWPACQRPTLPDNRTHHCDTADERGSAIRSNQEHHNMAPNRARVVNAWINSEAVHRISRRGTNSESCRPDICQSANPEDRNLDANASEDRNVLRTFVSHSLQGTRGVVSTAHSLPSANAEFTEAV